jgi:hypothetical protein
VRGRTEDSESDEEEIRTGNRDLPAQSEKEKSSDEADPELGFHGPEKNLWPLVFDDPPCEIGVSETGTAGRTNETPNNEVHADALPGPVTGDHCVQLIAQENGDGECREPGRSPSNVGCRCTLRGATCH